MTQWAELRSRGRQSRSDLQLVAIIGQRLVRRQRISVDQLQGLLAKYCVDTGHPQVPDPTTPRRWIDQDPGLPEYLLNSGLVSRSGLPRWVLDEVDGGRLEAGLEQRGLRAPSAAPRPSRGVGDYDVERSGEKPGAPFLQAAAVVGLAWLAAKIVGGITRPRAADAPQATLAWPRTSKRWRRRSFRLIDTWTEPVT